MAELLCPAGSREAALAALCNGADALYLGASAFGARVNAGFDREGLREIIDLCHFLGRRVHVTVNTLVKERELEGVRETLRMLRKLRADAILVQDLGVLSLIREEFPELCVHASTQMAIHNVEGARLLQQLGVRRVVLARECSLETIRAVAATGIETEVFIHGAQCVCVSGQCRYSGLIGGRSGNRGRCAQPCRLPYDWQGQTAAWLSPRDMCLRDHLQALTEAGVASLKIEGRLKRPEYVAVVTRSYREALDAIGQGCFAPADKKEQEALRQVFSRGFYPGYSMGARDAAVMNPQRVSSAGIPMGALGKVWKKGDIWLAEAQLIRTLHDGDGLQLRGSAEQDIVYSGNEVPAGGKATLRLHHPARTGDSVVRIDDAAQLRAARESFANLPRVDFDAELTAWPGQAVTLRVWDDRAEATVTGEAAQAAQNAALDENRARRSLEKTGDTLYTLRSLTVNSAGAYVPASALNELRRQALAQLRQARIGAWKLPEARYPALPEAKPAAKRRLLYAQFTDPTMGQALLDAGADTLIYAPLDLRDLRLDQLPENTMLALPVQLTDKDSAYLRGLGLPICAGSVGQLNGVPCMLGEGVPCWNHRAARMLRSLGGTSQILPRELSKQEIGELLAADPEGDYILPVYGRARLMYLNHCPARTALGLSGDRSHCGLCAEGKGCEGQALTDRRGEAFPLLPLHTEAGCLVQLLSCKARSLSDRADGRLSWLVDFTIESREEAMRVTRAYRTLLDGGQALIPGSLERYDVGVE